MMRNVGPMTRNGFLAWVFPAMLLLTALDVLLSGRDLTQSFLTLEREVESAAGAARPALLAWIQRGVSLLLLAASLERIVSHLMAQKSLPAPMLTWTFAFYWLTTVLAPGVFSPHPRISHEYLYSLFLGLACTLAGPTDRENILAAIRNALFVYILAGLVLVPFNPTMVLDSSYTQGLLPGVPRFGGLASHPVMMGVLAQTTLLILWARPFERRWLTVCAWLLGLAVLFLAQSKTAWLSFFISACCMVLVRRTPDSLDRMGNPRDNTFGVLLCVGFIAVLLALLVGVLVLDVPSMIDDFFSTRQGAQIASLTGRDRIWAVALEEWRNNPLFGYGPSLWDAEYRQAIGMPNATHGHNQLIDTLARNGTVGAIGLTLYFLALLVGAFRYARATRGLSLAMFVTTALLSVSEVPLILIDYGSHIMSHFLLLVVIASGAAATRARATVVTPVEPTLRTAS